MAAKQSKETKITVDLAVYPLEAIQAAAYSLTDRLIVRITGGGKKSVSVFLTPRQGDIEILSGEFHNEMLHESLRLQVSQANRKIREYIVTKALVSAQVASVAPSAADVETVPTAQESCSECETQQAQPSAPPVDAELEKEIEKLLAEIEKGDKGDDPLGVAVSWEEKYGDTSGKDVAPAPGMKTNKKLKAGKPGVA